MGKINRLQAEHIKRLLNEQNLRANALADMIGVTSAAVSKWKCGKALMKQTHAEAINECFPSYSVAYLMGKTHIPNDDYKRTEHMMRFETERVCFETLLKLCDTSVEYCFGDETPEPIDTVTITDGGEQYETPVYENEYAKLTCRNKTLLLTIEQWRAFEQEIKGYVSFRLSAMLERGAW